MHTLATSRYVLTAAHCQYVTPSRIPIAEVVVGELVVGTDPDCPNCSPVQRFKVTEADVTLHEKWNGKAVNLGNDIAIIRLPSNVETAYDRYGTFVLPVCLPRDEHDASGPLFTAVGWGKTEGPSDFSKLSVYKGVLQAVDVPAFDKQQCVEVSPTTSSASEERKVVASAFSRIRISPVKQVEKSTA
jgi:secreted trypsin-like serine protease